MFQIELEELFPGGMGKKHLVSANIFPCGPGKLKSAEKSYAAKGLFTKKRCLRFERFNQLLRQIRDSLFKFRIGAFPIDREQPHPFHKGAPLILGDSCDPHGPESLLNS